MSDLADRLAAARRAGEPAPEELERVVRLLADSDYEPSPRLARALEGLARWSETSGAPAPAGRPAAPAREPAPAALEARLLEFADSFAQPRPAAAAPRGRETGAPPIASLRAALAEIAERQKALDAEDLPAPRREPARAPAPDPDPRRTYDPLARRPRTDAASAGMAAELRAEIDRLGRSVSDLPTRREVDVLSREMSELAGRLSTERQVRLDPASLGAIDALVAEVDRMRGEAASPQAIADLAEELHAISTRLDALGPTNSGAIDTLARRIDDVRGELGQFPRAAAVDRLAGEIQSLIARLDEQERVCAPTRQAVVGLAHRVEALDGKLGAMAQASVARDEAFERVNATIRAELDRLPRAGAVTDLGRQIDALTESLKNRSAIGPALKAVEGLTGRVEALDGKIDAIVKSRAGDADWFAEAMRGEISAVARPDAFEALERQIAALGAKMTGAETTGARGDQLSGDLRALSGKIDGLGGRMQAVAEASGQRGAAFERIEASVRAIAEQLVRPRGAEGLMDGSPALEAEVSRLADGLERNDGRLDDLNAAFAGLAARIERACADLGTRVSGAAPAPGPAAAGRIETDIARSLSELRASAAQSERRASDALDAVRSTLERLLDRMEAADAAPAATFASFASPVEDDRDDAAPRPDAAEAARAAARRALAEILAGDEPPAPRLPIVEEPRFVPYADRDADEPIEPNSGAPRVEAGAGPTAASFIAAARRASAPSAAGEASAPEPLSFEARGPRFSGAIAKLKARRRPFLLGLAATLIVFAALYVASGITGQPAPDQASADAQSRLAPDLAPQSAYRPLLDAEPSRPVETARETPPSAPPPAAEEPPPPAAPAQKSAAAIAPRAPARDLTGFAFSEAGALPKAKGFEWKAADPATTGSISRQAAVAPGGMPDAIGGPKLRMRAAAGDPSAQLEVADRLLEGRNVEPDAASAAVWLEKAAAQGLAPAQQRIGSMYEKGRGVVRDVPAARRWYEQAAASGNVRAMHNLGVVYAEGGLGKPDYNAAVVWFRMAAERGLVDSQYNLAVLAARGLTGRRDLPEAYKWFALAADQGDEDAATKREEVGKALGAQLASAKAAVEAFRPRTVDAAANEVPAPAGGWDRADAR